MIGFYVFYVCVVVGWHWFSTQRRNRRKKEAASRSHFVRDGGSNATDELEPYRDEEEDENRSTHMYDGAEEQEHSEDNLFLVRETHSTQLSGSKSRSQSSPTGELRPFIPTPIPCSSVIIVPMDVLNLGHIHLHYQTLIYSLLLCANKVITEQVVPVHLCNVDNLLHLPLSHRIPPWMKRKTLSMGLASLV